MHWVHQKCCHVLFKKFLKKLFNEANIAAFSCGDVSVHMRKCEVLRYYTNKIPLRVSTGTPKSVRPPLLSRAKKRRYTFATSTYVCEYCKSFVDYSDLNHEMEYCTGFRSRPAFGGKYAYTPVKRARLVEYTAKKLRLESRVKFPP